jgi:UDPglucose 6-dehydrogenase
MEELYAPFVRTGRPIIRTDRRSAELGKYASNIFLAARISLINELARVASASEADIERVRQVIAADSRIGSSFLFSGVGFGGSCFPKDVRAAGALAREYGLDLRMVPAIDQVNRTQVDFFLQLVRKHFGRKLKQQTLAIWGLSFKPRTDDIRHAPSLTVIDKLLRAKVRLRVYDPAAMGNVRALFGNKLTYARDAYTCLDGADGLLVLTEWNQFRHPDFEEMKARLAQPVIFDGRNLYSLDLMRSHGFTYCSIGRPPVKP